MKQHQTSWLGGPDPLGAAPAHTISSAPHCQWPTLSEPTPKATLPNLQQHNAHTTGSTTNTSNCLHRQPPPEKPLTTQPWHNPNASTLSTNGTCLCSGIYLDTSTLRTHHTVVICPDWPRPGHGLLHPPISPQLPKPGTPKTADPGPLSPTPLRAARASRNHPSEARRGRAGETGSLHQHGYG